MSAGFEYAGQIYWGTNGAVQLCLEQMIEAADERHLLDSDDSVAAFLRESHEMFFMGAVVRLDELLSDTEARARFGELLSVLTELAAAVALGN